MNGYFDHNATTPLSEVAREVWLEAAARHWHNPSGLYREAGLAKRLLEEAREELGEQLGCEPERIVFNSGATEGNNAIFGSGAGEGRVMMSAVEHPSVREPVRALGMERVVEIPVTAGGVVDMAELEAGLDGGGIAMVSVMAANNETGVLQPWMDILKTCRKKGAPFHCDAAQWVGKMPMARWGACDLVTGSGHKFGGPKGVGFLVLPEGAGGDYVSQIGGPQESGHRAGTEDYPAVAAMVAALRARGAEEREAGARDWFEEAVVARIVGVSVVGAGCERLWNTSMLVMPAHSNLKWLTRLSRLGFSLSTGSACSSGKGSPSHVMEAMGLEYGEMGRVLRISGGEDTGRADWEGLLEALVTVWGELESGERLGGGVGLANLRLDD